MTTVNLLSVSQFLVLNFSCFYEHIFWELRNIVIKRPFSVPWHRSEAQQIHKKYPCYYILIVFLLYLEHVSFGLVYLYKCRQFLGFPNNLSEQAIEGWTTDMYFEINELIKTLTWKLTYEHIRPHKVHLIKRTRAYKVYLMISCRAGNDPLLIITASLFVMKG